MILFYDKRDGKIFANIDGRVHSAKQMKLTINNGIGSENIGKIIIGWEESTEQEEYEVITEIFKELPSGLFKKIKNKTKELRNRRIEHNIDKFGIMQEIEDRTPVNAFDYKVDLNTGNLIKMDKSI